MGFILREIGDNTIADGFTSCTETLGSESSDDRYSTSSTNEFSSIDYSTQPSYNTLTKPSNDPISLRTDEEPYWMEKRWLKQRSTFPPPLTSLNRLCQRNFILYPIRTDGRLEIREVKIDRPEVLCTSRENGRLTMTLHFVSDELEEEEEEESLQFVEQNEEIDDEFELDHEEEVYDEIAETDVEVVESDLMEEVDVSREMEEILIGGGDVNVVSSGLTDLFKTSTLSVSPGGGEGIRRCSEDLKTRRNRHHLHVWTTPHCVTTG